MKKVFFALIILLNIYIFSNITIPATISSNDMIFSLKDLIPNIENDRTLAFFSENTLTYESSKLKNIILSITDETDISFESTLITIMYEPISLNGDDSNNYNAENILIENNLTENILKDYFVDMLYNESPNATINEFEISKYMKDTLISTILSLDYRRSMNNIFGNFLVLDETKLKKYISFKANVSNFDYVYVAKENIDFKTPLNNNILEKKLIDIYSLNMSPLKINDNNIMKYYANRTIRKGEIIFENSVKKIPDVSAGQVIPLEVYFDGVKVLSWVKVLNDALIGETIMARNEKTGVLINGKLFPGPKLIIDIGGY
ncbi:flagella basal body P-ring formation protein FlgA [Marinitoga litoralis]|uniref:flagella basal body P-ring formation protein FlgA n=1 Tax=Marinitoga litoralis TaxID=570855 RepID=UPI00195FEFDB|nr:flagella basal body P-ring formation protein FlgA [Marinitoga litoralis]MBM7559031.1 flagella basal body P-ring formation protein FlgA [Marinitoga litoralis]